MLVLREAAQKAVAERRAQEAKAAQAGSAEAASATPQSAEVKSEQPGQGAPTGPSPAFTAGVTGESSSASKPSFICKQVSLPGEYAYTKQSKAVWGLHSLIAAIQQTFQQ